MGLGPRPEAAARAPLTRRLILLAIVVALLTVLASCGPETPRRPHVLVWMVDTLRADHLGCYGYPRNTSPVMDAFAQRGVLFEAAHAHSNWTQPSVASLLSGRHPPLFPKGFGSAVPDDFVMAAEWLGKHGYATAGMTVTVATAARFGFDQGFDSYDELDLMEDTRDRKIRSGAAWDADRVVDAASVWLDRRQDDRPFFLYLHTIDPHMPYEAHDETPAFTRPYDGPVDGSVRQLADALAEDVLFTPDDQAHLMDLYDGEIAYNDAQFGRMLSALEERGLLDDTLVVLLSDHGEEFWDRKTHGHGHRNLHTEMTRIPWIMSWPDGLPEGVRIEALARGVDLLPTVLDVAGLPPLPATDGRSMMPAVRGETMEEVVAFIERGKSEVDRGALRTEWMLYVWDDEVAHRCMYDLLADPSERNDILDPAEDHVLEDRFQAQRLRRSDQGDQVTLDDASLEALRELGYLR